MSEAERRRRLHAAYSILLDYARRKAAERDELGNPDRSAAVDAPAQEPDAQ
jgi:hypothetical protein